MKSENINYQSVWKEYENIKSAEKKSKLLKEFWSSNRPEDVDRIALQFINSRSYYIKTEALKALQILIHKNKVNTNNLVNYKKLISKIGTTNFMLYEYYGNSKLINKQELEYEIEQFVNENLNRHQTTGSQLNLHFSISENLIGYVTVEIYFRPKPSYRLDNLTYGVRTILFDADNGMFNRYPDIQVRDQFLNEKKKHWFKESNYSKYDLHIKNKKDISLFFQNAHKIEKELNSITLKNIETLIKHGSLTKEYNIRPTFVTLSAINFCENSDKNILIGELAKIGIEQLKNKTSGIAWRKYFEAKKSVSNNI